MTSPAQARPEVEGQPQPEVEGGLNVQAVRDAIEAMRTGTGDYDALVEAVRNARFAVKPTARTEEELAAAWDYVLSPDSFTDTVEAARWQKVLTPEQVGELRTMAQFVGPAPSRSGKVGL
jgi:hypothetical protein